jgi:hypothetical protein
MHLFYFIIISSNYIANLKIANGKKYLARYTSYAFPSSWMLLWSNVEVE